MGMCQQQLMGVCHSSNCAVVRTVKAGAPDLCSVQLDVQVQCYEPGRRHCTCVSFHLALQEQCCGPELRHCRESLRISAVMSGAS